MWIDILLTDFGIQWVGWIFSSLLRTERFYDLTGSATFAILTILNAKLTNWKSNSVTHNLQAACVLTWCTREQNVAVSRNPVIIVVTISAYNFLLTAHRNHYYRASKFRGPVGHQDVERLGSYLFKRILHDGRDRRFDKMRDSPSKMFAAWTMQGVWVFMTLLPSLILWGKNQRTASNAKHWSIEPMCRGFWLIGFAMEVIADYQKSHFRANPLNKDLFIQEGLWAYSRHPNYFGEILMWFALYLSASQSFTSKWEYLSIIGPIFDYLLITKVSGIPLLERQGLKKWGHLAAYRNYLSNTPSLIPFLK